MSTDSSSKDSSEKVGKKETDEICDDWEQLDQKQIKKSLQSIKITQDEEKSSMKPAASSKPVNSGPPGSGLPFVGPGGNPMNPIKILRRPPSDKNLKDMNVPAKDVQPVKTFEQREQEYAQARLRILGSAHPKQDSNQNNASTSGNNATNYNNMSK